MGIESLLTEFEKMLNIDKRCIENIELLNIIRNNAIHLVNKDRELASIVYEIGSANLKNYIEFVIENFNKDLSKYNFYLMPLSFYKVTFLKGDKNGISNSFIKSIDKDAITVNLTDEEIDIRYPLSYEELVAKLKARYIDFKQDKKFNDLNKEYRNNINNAYQRFLNNKKKTGNGRWQYSNNILNFFDKDYKKKQ